MVDGLSDDESVVSPEFMVVVAWLIDEHTNRKMHVHKGSTRPHKANMKRIREAGHQGLVPPHQSSLSGAPIPVPLLHVKIIVLGNSTRREGSWPLLRVQTHSLR
jgi:hypothetical protein